MNTIFTAIENIVISHLITAYLVYADAIQEGRIAHLWEFLREGDLIDEEWKGVAAPSTWEESLDSLENIEDEFMLHPWTWLWYEDSFEGETYNGLLDDCESIYQAADEYFSFHNGGQYFSVCHARWEDYSHFDQFEEFQMAAEIRERLWEGWDF